ITPRTTSTAWKMAERQPMRTESSRGAGGGAAGAGWAAASAAISVVMRVSPRGRIRGSRAGFGKMAGGAGPTFCACNDDGTQAWKGEGRGRERHSEGDVS